MYASYGTSWRARGDRSPRATPRQPLRSLYIGECGARARALGCHCSCFLALSFESGLRRVQLSLSLSLTLSLSASLFLCRALLSSLLGSRLCSAFCSDLWSGLCSRLCRRSAPFSAGTQFSSLTLLCLILFSVSATHLTSRVRLLQSH